MSWGASLQLYWSELSPQEDNSTSVLSFSIATRSCGEHHGVFSPVLALQVLWVSGAEQKPVPLRSVQVMLLLQVSLLES